MNYLERVVDRTVNVYRVIFFIVAAVVGWNVIDKDFTTVLISLGLVWIGYLLGFFVLILLIQLLADKQQIYYDLQQQQVAEINEKLKTGELKPGRELDELMRSVGLQPLPDIKEKGPVFGKFADADLYEWIDASIGVDGEVLRYRYIGQPKQNSQTGMIDVPNPGTAVYMTVDNILYEAKLENAANSEDQSNAAA